MMLPGVSPSSEEVEERVIAAPRMRAPSACKTIRQRCAHEPRFSQWPPARPPTAGASVGVDTPMVSFSLPTSAGGWILRTDGKQRGAAQLCLCSCEPGGSEDLLKAVSQAPLYELHGKLIQGLTLTHCIPPRGSSPRSAARVEMAEESQVFVLMARTGTALCAQVTWNNIQFAERPDGFFAMRPTQLPQRPPSASVSGVAAHEAGDTRRPPLPHRPPVCVAMEAGPDGLPGLNRRPPQAPRSLQVVSPPALASPLHDAEPPRQPSRRIKSRRRKRRKAPGPRSAAQANGDPPPESPREGAGDAMARDMSPSRPPSGRPRLVTAAVPRWLTSCEAGADVGQQRRAVAPPPATALATASGKLNSGGADAGQRRLRIAPPSAGSARPAIPAFLRKELARAASPAGLHFTTEVQQQLANVRLPRLY
eukprot:Hpha_TRINITY_DN11563_c0_g1::TRINITY_DN11563_c0_g1_i1::g.32312::m.32312